jgi:imidazolonepropionase-like amidohydrolase
MKKYFLFLFANLLVISVFGQRKLLYCGTLIDGISNSTKTSMTIIVEKNKIIAIENGYSMAQTGDEIIDLKSKTVLPGLIDMHVHIESETSKDAATKRMSMSSADIAFEAQKNGLTTLMAGFTTVRDLGGTGVNIALRNAINKGIVVGPRIFTSGKTIATTGGHGDPTNGWRPDVTFPENFDDGVVDSRDEARRAVRQRYKDGVDWIKITATGGVLSIAKNGKAPQFQSDELDGIIATANDYGFKVAAHAHGAEGMKRALKAGVTTIEHGTFMDDEAIALFKEKGAYLVPTIIAGKSTADSAKIPGYYHPFVTAKALETGQYIQATFAKAYKAGVKIAFGTDAGVYKHGLNAKEFQYMTEAGMPIMEALKSATIVAAEVLDIKKDLGSIEVNKIADIIATENNPLVDVKTLMNVVFVMKEGVVYKNK